MHNKFTKTAGFLGILILSSIPVKSVQRFAMDENSLFFTTDGKRVPTIIKTLTWRGVDYEPMPNRRAKGWLEWNVAPDNTPGPAPIYGEKVSVITYTDYCNMHYLGGLITKMEKGHPSTACYTTKLLLSGNPECVVLYWGDSGFSAISKENYAKRK